MNDKLKSVIRAANPEIEDRPHYGEESEPEIRLADVLLAIDYNSTSEKLKFGLSSNLFVIESNIEKILWNLKDDNLDNQSPETIKFLTELLCKD